MTGRHRGGKGGRRRARYLRSAVGPISILRRALARQIRMRPARVPIRTNQKRPALQSATVSFLELSTEVGGVLQIGAQRLAVLVASDGGHVEENHFVIVVGDVVRVVCIARTHERET